MLAINTRVRTTQVIDRYPHFLAPAGATGTVVAVEPSFVAVRMDEPIEGAEEWNNQIHWGPDDDDAAADLEIIA